MKLNVRVEGRTFEVEVVDLSTRPIVALVDGDAFEIWPEEPGMLSPPDSGAEAASGSTALSGETPRPARSSPVAAPRPSRRTSGALNTIYAPLPGVIDSISVQPGDRVDAGQQLCVLEAMKMKNIIRSSRSGEIARIHVTVGQHVKHNEALVEFLA